MNVSLVDLKAHHRAFERELKAAFARVLVSGQFVLGREVERFEEEVSNYLHIRHAIALSSGSDALLLALMALNIGPGDEVIVPSFTFFATAGSVARAGATPVFADIRTSDFNLCPIDTKRKITSRTRAIIPVDLFGQPAALDKFESLAGAHQLLLIEDAAQAFGAKLGKRYCGSFGTCAVFSFYPTKNLGGLGDGGMLVTNDDDLADRARILRVHGTSSPHHHDYVGANFRMDATYAALLRVKLPRVDRFNELRREVATFYTDGFSRFSEVGTAQQVDTRIEDPARRVIIPVAMPGRRHIWHQYTILVNGDGERERMRAHLTESGIETAVFYPIPLHRQGCFDFLNIPAYDCPVASRTALRCLSLPMYPEITEEQREAVIEGVGKCLNEVREKV